MICLFYCPTALEAQEDQTPVQESPPEKVKVKNADNFITEISGDKDVQYFRGNVKVVHDSIFMFSDSATVIENKMTAVGNVIIVQEDTINVFSDSLYYNGDDKLAKLYYNVVLKSATKELYTNALLYNLATKVGVFSDTAILKSNSMILSSLRGRYDVENNRAYFYDQVTIIDENFKLKSDSLHYDTDIDRAYFVGPTFIEQDGKQIYCEDGFYDIEIGRAYFTDNSIIRDGDQVAEANNILFSEADSTITLEGNASIKDSVSFTSGDKIVINDKTGDVLIEGNGYFNDENQVLEGPLIKYNKDSENLKLIGRSTVSNKNGYLIGDTIIYLKEEDFGRATGNVEWVDTVENRSILTDELNYREEAKYYKAFAKERRPLFSQRVDDDTLYLSADTLISANPSDTLSYLQATKDVKIFKTDLQAICDSLYYSDLDSIFWLFKDPVCWSDTTQFSGDTISIKLTEDSVSDIFANNNAFIITLDTADYYNQIKGKTIHSILDSGELVKMIIKGNAESIYLVKDSDNAYIGANKNLCSHMTFHFANKELVSTEFYTEPENTMVPMKRATDAELYLAGFNWRDKERPLSSLQIRTLSFSKTIGPQEPPDQRDDFEKEVERIILNEESEDNNKNEENRNKGKGDKKPVKKG